VYNNINKPQKWRFKMINAINNIYNDPAIGFILLALIAAFIICVTSIPKVMKECDVPETDNFDELKSQFFIESGKVQRLNGTVEDFFYIGIIRKNFIIFKTYEFLREEFKSKDDAEKFLLGNDHVSFRNNLHAILMVYRLRLLHQLKLKDAA
jgi:hypothetical protein